jgi:hypothetical protein
MLRGIAGLLTLLSAPINLAYRKCADSVAPNGLAEEQSPNAPPPNATKSVKPFS